MSVSLQTVEEFLELLMKLMTDKELKKWVHVNFIEKEKEI